MNRTQRITWEVKYNKKHILLTIYEPGDQVKILKHTLSSKGYGYSQKLENKYEGPFEVTRRIAPNLYELRDLNNPTRALIKRNITQIRRIGTRIKLVTLRQLDEEQDNIIHEIVGDCDSDEEIEVWLNIDNMILDPNSKYLYDPITDKMVRYGSS